MTVSKEMIQTQLSQWSPWLGIPKAFFNKQSNEQLEIRKELAVQEKDPLIETISNMRKMIRPQIDRFLVRLPETHVRGYRQRLNIITDAIVYMALSHNACDEKEDVGKHPIIQKIFQEGDCKKLFEGLEKVPITFENVIKEISKAFEVDFPEKQNFVQNLMNHEELQDKPEIRVALQMYMLKGHFSWVTMSKSEFSQFVRSDDQELPDTAKINCWEAVLYGMMKADVLDKQIVKDCYQGFKFNIYPRLKHWFDFWKSHAISVAGKPVENWENILSVKPYFIMIDHPAEAGMQHNMISVPFSQKQLLKMLITGKFDEKPMKAKLFSHWLCWTQGTFGTVRKKEFEEEMIKNRESEFRVTSVEKFVIRGKDDHENRWEYTE